MRTVTVYQDYSAVLSQHGECCHLVGHNGETDGNVELREILLFLGRNQRFQQIYILYETLTSTHTLPDHQDVSQSFIYGRFRPISPDFAIWKWISP